MKTSLILVHSKTHWRVKQAGMSRFLRVRLPSEPGPAHAPGGHPQAEWVPAHKVGAYMNTPEGRRNLPSVHIPDSIKIGGWSVPCIGLSVAVADNGDRLLRLMADDVNVLAEMDRFVEELEIQLAQAKASREIFIVQAADRAVPVKRKDIQP